MSVGNLEEIIDEKCAAPRLLCLPPLAWTCWRRPDAARLVTR